MSDPAESAPEPAAADGAVRALAAASPCDVVLPDDPRWADLSGAWNVHVAQQPAAVVLADRVEDVRATVRAAADGGLPVSVQPNGHGATEALSGTVLIRPVGLRGVSIDRAARRARVEAGVKWQQLLDALDGTGLMALSGSTGDVSVVGYHLGGGLPWFGRAYGTAAEYVRRIELVTPDGGFREVTAETDPELLWALCGAGGEFGVVTAIEIELVDQPPIVGGALMWPAEHTAEVLRAYAETTRSAPRELSLWIWLTTFPPFDPIPKELQGRSFANVNLTFLGERAAAEEALRPLRAVPGLEVDTVADVPLERIGDVAGEPTDPMPAMDWSHYIADLDDDFQARLLKANFPGGGSPLVACIRHLGGALSEPGSTAASGVPHDYLLLAFGFPFAPADEDAIRAQWGVLDDALGAHLTGRTHPNMLGDDPRPDRAFTADTLDRLRRIKRERDPRGAVRGNRPLRP
ncbi:FAD/FMN-containing dehydrogenase [Murinocardiopsis flavida]|uniref:FAD/FMN-containing dehydrogenase n=1 Tax=Murinocardiopsis flavida TaxID=645275 RepID=A0A2P8DQ54_9ACTN|nr:FAD-binding oxidoreductase [Murinocardiopsis flavida]PSK99321.1 FAD/FMN-containing dehydrogenase [Murinocardiopsis flavida]